MSVGTILAATSMAFAGNSASKAVDNTYNGLNTNLRGTLKGITSMWQKGAGKTLVTASNALRVEPLVLLDERVSRLPYATSILEAAHRLFSSYYLLSVSAENTIGSVTIQKRLGKFNPNPDLVQATADFLSVESYQFGLPFVGEPVGFERYSLYSPESSHPHHDVSLESDKGGGRDIMKQASEINNLSIGQIVSVKIVDGNNSASIPIMIRLRVLGTSPQGMVNILGVGSEDTSRSARIRKFKVGELGLKELLTNQDIIDRYRRASFADKTGYFRKAHKQAKSGLLSTMFTGEPSIGDISSMSIVSRQTMDEFEREHYVKMENFAQRQQIFEKSLLMMLFVVDDDAQTVTIYTRDIEDSQQYWLKDIERSAKSGGNDITDLLKSFLSGQIPGRL